ncbi:MAG: 3-deoxy-8-phosphooctulonate synthase [Proteobacteria bacterium]|nr:3-deoxy-8-phosphooctulonate synthase [Pseudomonadota bacterium]
MNREIKIQEVAIGGKNPFVLIAGPCVIEGREETLRIAESLQEITSAVSVPLIFKSSYDKANRSSLKSFRGPGLERGLEILREVRKRLNLPVLSDVHRFEEIQEAASVLDVIQIPAFLCRQTDFVMEVARTGKPVNVKKGPFIAPLEVKNIIDKITSTGNQKILITERGFTFGYNNLVADMRSLVILKQFGYPVVFDATHSVQLPGGNTDSSGGEREFIPPLSRAAVAVGVDALFLEVHEKPDQALCDGPNSLTLKELPSLLSTLKEIDRIVKEG